MFRDYSAELSTNPAPGEDFLVTLYDGAAEPGAWPFDISKEADHLDEDLPPGFGFDNVMEAADAYDPIKFEVSAGEITTVVLRAIY